MQYFSWFCILYKLMLEWKQSESLTHKWMYEGRQYCLDPHSTYFPTDYVYIHVLNLIGHWYLASTGKQNSTPNTWNKLNLTCMSSAAETLCSGFLTRHFETKSMNSGDHLSGLRNDGGGLVGIMNIAWNIDIQWTHTWDDIQQNNDISELIMSSKSEKLVMIYFMKTKIFL